MTEIDPPPFLGTWPRVYLFIAIYLVLLITVLYAFTVHFTR